MNNYVKYIENTLHVVADISMYAHGGTLPLYLRNGYEFRVITIFGVSFLLAKPNDVTNLAILRKQIVQIKKFTEMECVLCLDNVRVYSKEKLLAEGIPFIVADSQMYMPFLGIVLSKKAMKEIPQNVEISFATQKLLLTAIYQGLNRVTLTEMAKKLGLSKMTISRCFDELQALDFSLVATKGKTRLFTWDKGSRALWETVLPILKNPIARQYRLEHNISRDYVKLSGISAISHYSMLADNHYDVYAITKEVANSLKLESLVQVPENETPKVIVHVLRYELKYKDDIAIDPLSAILTLTDEEKDDPRVKIAIEEILGGCLYD